MGDLVRLACELWKEVLLVDVDAAEPCELRADLDARQVLDARLVFHGQHVRERNPVTHDQAERGSLGDRWLREFVQGRLDDGV